MFILSLLACKHDFTNPDDACKSPVPGEKNGTAVTIAIVDRMNCYRRLAGISRGNIKASTQEAASAHASYLQQNQVPADTTNADAETPGLPGFTGQNYLERLIAAGDGTLTTSNSFVWLWAGIPTGPDDPNALADDTDWKAWVDTQMVDPYFRQITLQPDWRGAGFALDTGYWYGHVIANWPPSEHTLKPIVYPTDGQVDVPTSFPPLPDIQDGGALWMANYGVGPGNYGYPISFTVGGDVGDIGSDNPLNLSVEEYHLAGPDGTDLPAALVLPHPNLGFGDMPLTAFIMPMAPLEPDTTYTITETLSWSAHESDTFDSSFTTAAASAE